MGLKLGGYLKHIKTCCALQLKKHGKLNKFPNLFDCHLLEWTDTSWIFFNSRIGGLWHRWSPWKTIVDPHEKPTRQATSWKARQASVPERPGFGSSENGGIITSIEMAIEHHWIPSLNIFENGGIPHWTLNCEERYGKQVSWNILKPSIKQSHSSSASSTRASTAQNHAKKRKQNPKHN